MRSVAKHSYIKGARGKAKAKAHVNYIQYRRGEDRENGQPRPFFSDSRDSIQGLEVKKDIDEQERSKVVVHKLILSPGLQGVNVQAYTREIMQEVGRAKGLDLNWRAVVHENTDHDHAHVVIFGKDKNGREVLFRKDDYAKMREVGDRYLERNHFYERFLERDIDPVLKKGYERERGDDLFERLVGDLSRRGEPEAEVEHKRYQAQEWDKERAIEYLPKSEKIERDGETYSRYSRLEDLKEFAGGLKESGERIPHEQYKKLWQWIGTKERAGDDYYERKAKEKWDRKEKRKEQDPFQDEREFKKLDKDLRKSFKEMERQSSSGDFGKGYKQRLREAHGRFSADHGHYTSAQEVQRLKDLMERFPEKTEEYQRQIDELKSYDAEQRSEAHKSSKWRDFDLLLGEDWRAPKPEKQKELEQKQQPLDEKAAAPDKEQSREQEQTQQQVSGERQLSDIQIRAEYENQSGDQSGREQQKERDDDAFGRGER